MKKAKRALALALVFALVASFCVTGAAAVDEPGERQAVVNGQYVDGQWREGGNGSYTDEQSGVTVSKTAEAVSGEDNQYEVTLKVEVPVTTSTKSASAATVLVIDVSGSMDYCAECGGEIEHEYGCSCTVGRDKEWIGGLLGHYGYRVWDEDTRINAAQKAAKEFVNGYCDTENDTPRYVAIVSFGQYGHNVSHYWYDVSTDNGYKAVIDAIDGLDTPWDDNGGTNLDGGLSKAEELFKGNDYIIDDVPQENRFAIALTDGRPTFSEYEGDGTSCNQKILNDTKETADDLKNEAKLYTVCFGAAEEVCWEGGYQEDVPTVGEFLENSIASKGCAYEASDGDALSNIFNQLTDKIKDSLKNLTVTDPMATGVSLVENSIEGDGAEVNGRTINWTLSNYTESGETRTYTLTYTVTVDPDKFEGQEEGYYPLNGETYLTIPSTGGQTGGVVQFPVPGVYVTPTVTENSGSIIIQVYVDGSPVEINNEENFATYISGLQNGENTDNWSQSYNGDGNIVGAYSYEKYDSADIVLTPNGNYVLQGIEGTFIQGETAWTGITPSGAGWKIDNVKGGSTLKVYLNTKYSVKYVVTGSETIDAPTDDAVYVTGAGVTSDNSNQPVTGQDGEQRSWKNDGLNTSITIKPLPDGTTGWTDEATPTGTHDKDDEIGVADAVTGGLDADGDHTFTFTATAVNYTVTYTDGVESEEVFADQTYDGLTYGEDTPDFLVDGSPADPKREGYTFEGWSPEVADTVTETVTYVAQWEEITGTLTVTKTFEGLDEDVLPEGFTITVTGTSGAADGDSYTLTIGVSDDENKNIEYSYDEASGAYKWVISGAALGNYSVSESNTQVIGYKLDTSASTQSDTMTLTDTATSDSAALKNVYVKDNPGLSVEKTVHSVNGSTDIPAKVEVDDVIVYKIVVENTGNVALTGISVTDELAGQLYTDESCETAATLPIASLDAGASATFYAKYTVKESDAGSTLTNTAVAKADDDTTGEGEEEVDVKKQYTLTINHYYDEVGGETVQASAVQTLNEGDSWTATPLTNVDKNGVNYIFDVSLSTSLLSGTISGNVTVNLVYVKDEWKDEDPDGDSETGGDGTPDYQQALIKYKAETGGTVDPTIDVETLTDEDGDGKYSGEVKAESTATAGEGYVFDGWTGPDGYTSVEAKLSHEFTAEGGKEYVYTASFKTGTTDAKVTKTLVSYTRDGVTVEIPADFKARVGDVLNYAITIENTGEVALNTTVRDTIDGKGTLAINPGTGYTVEDGVITITNLAPNATVTISASYTVVEDDIGQTITNTATVDLPGDEPGGDPTDEEKVEVDEYGITVTPADITIYMGGDEGYVAVVDENGQVISDNNSLPTPLFTVELSESFGELSVEQIEAIVIAGTTSGEGARGWSFDYAGETEDGEDLYYIVPNAGQDPIRVTYTNAAGEEVVSDHFDPAAIDELFAEFAIKLYTDTVTSVTATVDDISCKIDYSGTGTLTVRAVDDTDENPVVGVQEALPRPVEAGEGAVTAPAGTTYALNETTVTADAAGVGLLFDGIIDDEADRTGALLAELESELGVTVEDGNYQAQYLDLVDAHNGNAWVKASGAVTVYWGYPEGTGEDTNFALYHFEGLHREGENSGFDIEDVATSDIERVQITKTANGIAFDIGSGGFSPFVLVWDDGEGGDEPWWPPIDPGDDGDDGGDGEFVPKWLNIDDHYAYIIGYEDGTVRPQGNITRAEVATIFFRLLTDEVREEYWSTESGYSDVSSSDWYNNAISTLSNLGVITGYEDGTFRPNASISRAEFVTIATRFFDYTAEYEGTFSDVSYSSWYADFVQAAVDMGLVNGYENGTFRPNASITRAEAVAIVNRVLLRRPDAEHLLSWAVMNTFSDNADTAAWYYADIQEATNSHDYDWITYSGERIEDWTEKLEKRDWAALEREWSSAYDAPGGEVTG